MSLLEEVLKQIEAAPPEVLKNLEQQKARDKTIWYPNVGPQKEAAYTLADDLFYGGQAGGGKTDLLAGLSLTAHTRSLILRRTNKEASKLLDRYIEIVGHRDGWNGQDHVWRFPDGKVIDISGCQHEDDKQKWKGNPHDLIGFDEIGDFSETQFRFIKGWNRSAKPGQRCRVVATGNPPTTPEGLWVLQYWGAWLDPTHPNPAKPGELRWYTTIAGKDQEVDGPGPHLIDGEYIRARSRTFIPAALSDNPDLARTDYASVLAALPEELRAAYKEGRFDAGLKDDEFQAIPTAWIVAAQERWRATGGKPPINTPMSAMGLDVAQGGDDQTVLAMRYDAWYAPVIAIPGRDTPTPSSVAGLVVTHLRNGAPVIVDVGGGYGGGVVERLKENNVNAVMFNGAGKAASRTKDNALSFINKRAEAIWRLREELDPDQPGGSVVCLPDDPALRADLASYRWKLAGRGIQIEEKLETKKRIGRSPDKGDAVVMAWSEGQLAIRRGMMPGAVRGGGSMQRPAFSNVGYAGIKAKRRGH